MPTPRGQHVYISTYVRIAVFGDLEKVLKKVLKRVPEGFFPGRWLQIVDFCRQA